MLDRLDELYRREECYRSWSEYSEDIGYHIGKLRIKRELFIQEASHFEIGPFLVNESVAVEGAHESYVFGVQAMLWIHSLCEFVSEAFRADEFLDFFTLAVLGPHEGVFYFASTLFTPLGTGIPDISVHICF